MERVDGSEFVLELVDSKATVIYISPPPPMPTSVLPTPLDLVSTGSIGLLSGGVKSSRFIQS